jgi:predicted NBD/HSP70 family sugar kinase
MPTADRIALRRNSGVKIADQWLRQILSLLYQRRNLSRIEIIETTGLNAASVSHALRYLVSKGVLHNAGECDAGTGRRRERFTLNAEAGYFVALDLEGDRLRFALTNFLGDVRCRWEECLEFRQPLALDKVVLGIGKVTRDLDRSQLSRVLAVGVSYPGLLDPDGNLSAVNLGWNKIPLLAVLKEAFPWPVFMERDKETCIHAESWLGAAQKCSNALFLIAEGGIGMGILVDRHHVMGTRGFSGEIGHCKFLPDAEDLCNCGQKGCLEAIASGVNIARQYAERAGAEPGSFRFVDVLEKARRGDSIALAVFELAGRALGSALSTAISLLDPEIVILGGDLIAAEDVMLPILWDQIQLQTQPRSLEVVKIVVSGLGLDIRLKGTASLAFRNMLEAPELIQRMCVPVRETAPEAAWAVGGRTAVE